MTDLALTFDTESGADIAIENGQLVLDDGLRTAILISLFSDARASVDDDLPAEGSDRRGWWGDDYARDDRSANRGGAIGSLLWLLARSKILPETLARAREAALSALSWLGEDGIARAVDIAVEVQESRRLALSVLLDRPTGPARQRYDFLWEASWAG